MSNEERKKDEKLLDKLNNAFIDFVGNAFGESGREFIEDTSQKVKEFSSSSIKQFMEFADTVLENLKLNENEQVMKTRDSVEDLLKQMGLLEEDEDEF
jgi:predicted urease superfamily metal-dependent hydrolase